MAYASYKFYYIDMMVNGGWIVVYDGPNPPSNTLKLTVSGWFKWDPEAEQPFVFSAVDFSTFSGVSLAAEYDGFVYVNQAGFDFADGVAWVAPNPSEDEDFDPEVWHHVVFSLDKTKANPIEGIRCWYDGVLLDIDYVEAWTQNSPLPIDWSKALWGLGGAHIAFLDVVFEEALTPEEFAFSNNGVWTRKPRASIGPHDVILDGSNVIDVDDDGNIDLVHDVSGNGFVFVPFESIVITVDYADLPPWADPPPVGISHIFAGAEPVRALYKGGKQIVKVYYGDQLVFGGGTR